jgi:histidinol-phosphate aminotransferase
MKTAINSLLRENIRKIIPYSTARDEYTNSGASIFLDANENPFNNGLNRYPDPKHKELRQRISSLKEIPVENIFTGNGSDEIIDLLIRAFCEPGRDKIMLNPPTYGMYEVSAQINGNKVVKVNLRENFEPDVDAIIKQADKNLKILFLCSPNNPTGNLYRPDLVERLLKGLNTIVVIDEAYIDFSTQKSWIYRLEKFPNLVVMQTFSKARGMAGIRLGMAFGSGEIVDVLNKIKLPYNINNLSQKAALQSLENQAEYNNELQLIIKERERLLMELQTFAMIEKVFPSESNFILCRVQNANELYTFLTSRGIIVRNRSGQVHCNNCIRITVGTPFENTTLLKELKEFEKLRT